MKSLFQIALKGFRGLLSFLTALRKWAEVGRSDLKAPKSQKDLSWEMCRFPDAYKAFGPPPLERFPPYQLDEELERLANGRLLTLSRVCARWHSIVIGTPMLWTVFQLNSILWSTPSGLKKTMQILADGLERSRNLPITVQIFDQLSLPPPTRLFGLLARHSERWQRAHITSSIEDIDLSVLKGKLPLLQYLIISVSGSKSPEPSATQILNLCQDAPCLKIVYIPTVLLENVTIPFQQLDALICEVAGPASVARAVSVMSKLRRGASYHLQFFSRDEANPPIPLRIPPTMSTISSLAWRIVGGTYPRHYFYALGEFLANLTLPNLAELRVMCDNYPRQEFLSLCARSGFEPECCLKVLRIPELLITEEDLIQLLCRLESLEHLEIADRYGEGTDSVLVTDTFLRAIALPAASSHMPRLVPRLRHFACASRMGFTDNVFIDFVISRLVPICSPGNPLSIYLCPPTYVDVALHRAAPVHAAMEQLVARSKRRLRCRRRVVRRKLSGTFLLVVLRYEGDLGQALDLRRRWKICTSLCQWCKRVTGHGWQIARRDLDAGVEACAPVPGLGAATLFSATVPFWSRSNTGRQAFYRFYLIMSVKGLHGVTQDRRWAELARNAV
ncbi:hypothetical protein GGX14DRAFT_407022 [Mycena pura]|uniref:F-box domain-containing protein n=1 Tax=Mycena pura TaxID=153505 RepID=A0AAD6UNY8_9AGAR|nr:hypothetical protein GGX14DRAFT_407022 [Mycena pura]